jgi:hypothetical protein
MVDGAHPARYGERITHAGDREAPIAHVVVDL